MSIPYDDTPEQGVLVIPYDQLSGEALDAIVTEYVLREGTDYGTHEVDLNTKKEQVLVQLKRADVVLLFDPITETCHIEQVEVARQYGLL